MNNNAHTRKGSLLVRNIGELATPRGFSARTGDAMKNLHIVHNAAILCIDGKIVFAGPESELALTAELRKDRALPELDACGNACIPGFVDSHTHFIFGSFRDDEFFWRAEGLPYMEIHKRGGGIGRSTLATRTASSEELFTSGKARLDTMLRLGVSTVEGKSGYGLDLDTEIKQLNVMRVLADKSPVTIVPTYMGAHSVPQEFAGRAHDYVDFMLHNVVPEITSQGLAQFADIFCEKGVFELDESRRFLKATRAAGLKIKLHADEIVQLGGAGLAAELRATSADHLLKASNEDLARMAQAGVVATCLPLTAFILKEAYAPARAMIDMGLAVALASDLNPGSCYSQSIPLIIALSILYMNMSMPEVLTALTLNGAAALDMADKIGSVEIGKMADFIVLDAPSYSHLAYHTGMNCVSRVVKNGVVVL